MAEHRNRQAPVRDTMTKAKGSERERARLKPMQTIEDGANAFRGTVHQCRQLWGNTSSNQKQGQTRRLGFERRGNKIKWTVLSAPAPIEFRQKRELEPDNPRI